ncbi:unnamed protein product [Aspergillus oryzae var. brunneus]|uniref:Unnamed protein product n=1 Tax=Aspergillus oryzae var. brunneus TaxID=332754 RepID=A0ABQ6KT80_ASPOZ|nr:unnamed protein product [Aspergillus oryzae]GMG45271.1 unnamed protein product [Aspergillus oryzae var. brunneus]
MNIVPGLALMIIMGRRITEQYKSPKKKSNNENSSQEFMTGMDLMLSSCDFHKSRKTHKKKEDGIEREADGEHDQGWTPEEEQFLCCPGQFVVYVPGGDETGSTAHCLGYEEAVSFAREGGGYGNVPRHPRTIKLPSHASFETT